MSKRKSPFDFVKEAATPASSAGSGAGSGAKGGRKSHPIFFESSGFFKKCEIDGKSEHNKRANRECHVCHLKLPGASADKCIKHLRVECPSASAQQKEEFAAYIDQHSEQGITANDDAASTDGQQLKVSISSTQRQHG